VLGYDANATVRGLTVSQLPMIIILSKVATMTVIRNIPEVRPPVDCVTGMVDPSGCERLFSWTLAFTASSIFLAHDWSEFAVN